MSHRLHRADLLCTPISLVALLLLSASCGGESRSEQPRAAYTSIAQLQQTYGRLVTVSNSPTLDQNGTGDRLGLFRDEAVRCGAYR